MKKLYLLLASSVVFFLSAEIYFFMDFEPLIQWFDPIISSICGISLAARSLLVQRSFVVLTGALLSVFYFALLYFCTKKKDLTQHFPAKVFLVFVNLAGSIFFIIISNHLRMAGDDFLSWTDIHFNNFIEFLPNYYCTWAGRYTSPLILLATISIPMPVMVRIFPLVVMGLMVAGFFLIAKFLFENTPQTSDKRDVILLALLCALLLTYSIICITPSVFSSVFWLAGSANYGAGLALALFSWGLFFTFLNKPFSLWRTGLLFLISLLVGGSNELSSASMCVLTFAALLYNHLFVTKEKRFTRKIWLFFCFNLIFTIVSYAAPGNRARMSNHPTKIEGSVVSWLLTQMLKGLTTIYSTFIQTLFQNAGLIIILMSIFLLVGALVPLTKRSRLTILYAIVFLLIASFVCFTANATVMWAPGRTLITPSTWVLLSFALLAFLCGSCLSHPDSFNLSFPILLTVTILSLCVCLFFYNQNISELRSISSAFDFREALLEKADPSAPIVETCTVSMIIDDQYDIGSDADFYINQSAASVYGLQKLIAHDSCENWMHPQE